MSDYRYPSSHYAQGQQGTGYASYGYMYQWYAPGPAVNHAVELGKFGAVVGLCGAGAANLRRLQEDRITRGEAVVDTLRMGAAAGVATAAATMVASQFRSGVLSLAATLVTGGAVMYLLQSVSDSPTTDDAPVSE
jgi:hypothetical protein